MPRCCLLLLIGAIAAPSLATAQSSDAESRLKDLLKRTTVELREAQDENATLKAKQSEDDGHIQDLTQQLAAAKQSLADTEGKPKQSDAAAALGAAEQRAKTAEDQMQQQQANLAKWQDAYKQAADVARQRDADAKTLAAGNADLEHRIADCAEKNVELFDIGTDILAHYQNIDLGDLMERKEVFTQLARVKLENAVQDYRNKLRDQKLHAAAAQTAPPAPASGNP